MGQREHNRFIRRFSKSINGEEWDAMVMREFVDSVENFKERVEVDFTEKEREKIKEVKARRLLNPVRDSIEEKSD